MIKCSFVFWQQLDYSKGGEKFITRYKVRSAHPKHYIFKEKYLDLRLNKVSEFPNIFIIDPRTGAVVWKHTGQFKAKLLAEKRTI